MRVVEPLEVEGVNVLGREVDGDHRRRPARVSWGVGSVGEVTDGENYRQSSTLGREEYISRRPSSRTRTYG
jgi:hypothetical protein